MKKKKRKKKGICKTAAKECWRKDAKTIAALLCFDVIYNLFANSSAMISKIRQEAKQYKHHTERNLTRPPLIIIVHDNSTKYLKSTRRKEILTFFSEKMHFLSCLKDIQEECENNCNLFKTWKYEIISY